MATYKKVPIDKIVDAHRRITRITIMEIVRLAGQVFVSIPPGGTVDDRILSYWPATCEPRSTLGQLTEREGQIVMKVLAELAGEGHTE